MNSNDLSKDELESLYTVARGGMLQPNIPPQHRDRLVSLGLVREGLGGLVITPEGKKLAGGREYRR